MGILIRKTFILRPSAIERPIIVEHDGRGNYKKGEILMFAPYSVKMKVKKVYKDNLFKKVLRFFGLKIKYNKLQLEKTKLKVT